MRILRIHHVAIAVDEMGPLTQFLSNDLGLGTPYLESRPSSNLDIAMFAAGNAGVELLHPTGPGSSVPAFMAERGAGLFHVCFEVDDIVGAMAELTAKGLRFRTQEPQPGHHGTKVSFIDPASSGGVLFELLEAPQ
jgi:methylmalonyl-CoA/ethylmalonyl-CoA epimerase